MYHLMTELVLSQLCRSFPLTEFLKELFLLSQVIQVRFRGPLFYYPLGAIQVPKLRMHQHSTPSPITYQNDRLVMVYRHLEPFHMIRD